MKHFLTLCRLVAALSVAAIFGSSALAVGIAGQGTWESTLQARDFDGNGTTDGFYDTKLNITWLDLDVGLKTWSQANAWIDALNANGGLYGYTNWRLPTTRADATVGYDVPASSSEWASLYYDTLGNRSSKTGAGLTNTGSFQHLKSVIYFSGTQYNDTLAWGFATSHGYQNQYTKTTPFYVMAVLSPAPEPETYAMLLAGLALMGSIARRRKV